MQVETDLPIVSGTQFLELGPGQNTSYNLSVTPWKQGKETGDFVSFLWLFHSNVLTKLLFPIDYNNAVMIFDVFWNSLYKYELCVFHLHTSCVIWTFLNNIYTFMFIPAAQYDSHECQVMIPFFSCRISVVSTDRWHARSRQIYWWA